MSTMLSSFLGKKTKNSVSVKISTADEIILDTDMLKYELRDNLVSVDYDNQMYGRILISNLHEICEGQLTARVVFETSNSKGKEISIKVSSRESAIRECVILCMGALIVRTFRRYLGRDDIEVEFKSPLYDLKFKMIDAQVVSDTILVKGIHVAEVVDRSSIESLSIISNGIFPIEGRIPLHRKDKDHILSEFVDSLVNQLTKTYLRNIGNTFN